MEHGIVYHRNITGRMFVVKLVGEKYSVFECHDITSFNVGDKLYGHLNDHGLKQILHSETLKWHSVYVHKIEIDEHNAMLLANQ